MFKHPIMYCMSMPFISAKGGARQPLLPCHCSEQRAHASDVAGVTVRVRHRSVLN